MATPHIEANVGDFAKTVIMPGDPNRARFIAENFMDEPRLVNSVRGILAWTGKYKGKPVSVMASGMGNASMGIYSHELFNEYGVENIIRVGTCGIYGNEFHVGDIAVAEKSVSRSNFMNLFNGEPYELFASKKLVQKAQKVAVKLKAKARLGNVYCTDTFYGDVCQKNDMQNFNCFGVEMETTALYKNAMDSNKNAIALLTVSDNIETGEAMTAKERELSLGKMILFAMEMAI